MDDLPAVAGIAATDPSIVEELLLKQQQLIAKTTVEPKRNNKIITNANVETRSNDSKEGGYHQEVNWIREDLDRTGLKAEVSPELMNVSIFNFANLEVGILWWLVYVGYCSGSFGSSR